MPELLIYVVPAFAGIIGSRYLTRLANFCLMVVVFQFDLAVLLGQLKAAVFTPYTVICIIPALAGIVGDRYLRKCKHDLQIGSRYFLVGKLANALLIIVVFYVCGRRTAGIPQPWTTHAVVISPNNLRIGRQSYSAAGLYFGCDGGLSASTLC